MSKQNKDIELTSLSGRCVNCRHWQGDKEEVANLYIEKPIIMDKFKGWASFGKCGVAHEWAFVEILGDAKVRFEVPAYFGCLYFESENKP